jgi:hypothetical protein
MVKDNTPPDVTAAMEYLLLTVAKHGGLAVGFVFNIDSELPWIGRISSVSDDTFDETMQTLVKSARSKVVRGNAITKHVSQAS